MVVGVVNKPERADRTRFQAQISHHPFGRSKRQFAGGFLALRDEDLLQPMLYVMNRQVFVARETDEVMLVALVIAHEDILAMHRPVVVPPTLRLLDGLAFGVVIGREGDVMVLQIPQHFLLPLGKNLVLHNRFIRILSAKIQLFFEVCKKNLRMSKKSSTFVADLIWINSFCMKEISTKKLMDTIIEGIRNRKGQRIVTIDLRKIKEAPVEMMVICEGQSNTQVSAIADEIDDFVRTTTHVHPLSVAGQENAEWIAMDYGTIFVHVMQREPRAFYDIEHLWADGKVTELPEE